MQRIRELAADKVRALVDAIEAEPLPSKPVLTAEQVLAGLRDGRYELRLRDGTPPETNVAPGFIRGTSDLASNFMRCVTLVGIEDEFHDRLTEYYTACQDRTRQKERAERRVWDRVAHLTDHIMLGTIPDVEKVIKDFSDEEL